MSTGRPVGPATPDLDRPNALVEVYCWCHTEILRITIAQFTTAGSADCGRPYCAPLGHTIRQQIQDNR